MNCRNVKLIDSSHKVVALAQVSDEGNGYGGSIDLTRLPTDLRTTFDEFEEAINGQMFTLADEIESRIASKGLRAVFDNGQDLLLKDLQIFPSTGEVSFRLEAAHAAVRKPA